MTPHAIARLYTLAEVEEAARIPPHCELEARFRYGLTSAIGWSHMLDVRCAICNSSLDGVATYLIVLMPADAEMGLGISGAVCTGCGQNLPRERLQQLAEQAARVMFEPAAGSA